MNKNDIITFFDQHAQNWDDNRLENEEKINRILDYAGIKEEVSVLDVACGTGVLFPYYLNRGVSLIIGVDISPEMVAVAKNKFWDSRTKILCSDIEECKFSEKFDCCMVFNAFPHFINPANLISCLGDKIKKGGRLTVAHDMSRTALDAHHLSHANKVSIKLLSVLELSELFVPYFDVDIINSDDEMYVVSGVRK